VGLLVLLGFGASWTFLAAKAARVNELEVTIQRLQTDQEEVAALAAELDLIGSQYEGFRRLFGTGVVAPPSSLWSSSPGGSELPSDAEANEPRSWPLADRGFVTQSLLEGEGGEHPGVDIAVPTGTYIRAAGGGFVAEVGDDEVYGKFVVIDHENGYRSRYAHASEVLVGEGASVIREEVIALTGSTGRSTAPHLHFEILLESQPIDPLTMINPL
jgi:murein DD-endopeptidase MepM/ murein hydrolase activator NlpD